MEDLGQRTMCTNYIETACYYVQKYEHFVISRCRRAIQKLKPGGAILKNVYLECDSTSGPNCSK